MESPNRASDSDSPLLTEDEKDFEGVLPSNNGLYDRKRRLDWWQHWSFKLVCMTAYSLFLLAIPGLWTSSSLDSFLTYTPAKEAISYHKHKFDGSLGLHTKYTGEPRPEAEEAWSRIFTHYNIRFTADEMHRLNRTALELQNGGGYYGQLSVYHHLHCLKMLRQLVWYDSYNVSIPDLRGHADHCIDDIRQALMCKPDLSVVTFYWHPEYRKPRPDFHLDQTCVNWDKLDAWASKRSFSIFDQKTLVHPQLGLSFPIIDGEIQVHEGHSHNQKQDQTAKVLPVWPADVEQ